MRKKLICTDRDKPTRNTSKQVTTMLGGRQKNPAFGQLQEESKRRAQVLKTLKRSR